MERQVLAKAEPEHLLRKKTAGNPIPARSSLQAPMRLQRQFGNQAMGHFLQAKLKIGESGDIYEQEADRIADQVMRMPDPNPPTFSQGAGPQIQRKCAACATGQGLCPKCAEEEMTVQRVAEDSVSPSGEAPPLVHEVLNSSGEPLDTATRAFFEPRFGQDFSQVRVHTGPKAAESAKSVKALAYTVGRDIVFATGQYQPAAAAGRKLLAHELTHTLQQGAIASGSHGTQREHLAIAPLGRHVEQKADRVASADDNDGPLLTVTAEAAVPVLQREDDPGAEGKERSSIGSGPTTDCLFPGYSQCDFIDQHISVPGQFALYDLYKQGGHECADAVAMMSNAKKGTLQGIYQANERKPALLAERHGTTWWQLVSERQGATVVEFESPPMLVFNMNLAGNCKALANALEQAWSISTMGQSASIVVPPSLKPCPLAPPTDRQEENKEKKKDECPPGTIPDPSGDICTLPGQIVSQCNDTEMAQELFRAQENCATIRMSIDLLCSLGPSACDSGGSTYTKPGVKFACDMWERIFGKSAPGSKHAACDEPLTTFYEKCVVSEVISNKKNMRCDPGSRADILDKYQKWPGRVK